MCRAHHGRDAQTYADKTLGVPGIEQGGTERADYVGDIAIGDDGSVFLAGATYGDWGSVNAGGRDFAATKLNADGIELWRWQVRL